MVSRFVDKIEVYEDQFPQDIKVFINTRRIAKGLRTSIPAVSTSLTKTTRAFINHGRWIVECPGGCTDAVMASDKYRVFVCSLPMCAEKEYIRITFPAQRVSIEIELLKRPLHASGMKLHANWVFGESLQNLRDELAISDNLPRATD